MRVLLALLISCSAALAAPNLLTDPGFEGADPPLGNMGPNEWFAPFEPVDFSTADPSSGAQSALLVSTDTAVGMVAQVWDTSPADNATYLVGVHAKLMARSDGWLRIWIQQGAYGTPQELIAYANGTIEHPPGNVIATGVDFSTFQRLSFEVTTSGTEEIGVAFIKEIDTSGGWNIDGAFAYEQP